MKKLLTIIMITGMNFACASGVKFEPMPDSVFDSKDAKVILNTSARCSALFFVLSTEFQEPKLRVMASEFIYLANNLGFNSYYSNSVITETSNSITQFYVKESKNPKSKVIKSDMWKCPYLLERFKV